MRTNIKMAAVTKLLQLTLVRHGETAANKEHVLQGQMDTALSEHGRRQSVLTGRRLAFAEIVSHIYCSDLSRAAQTAELIRGELGYEVQVTLDTRLRERAYGKLEGQPLAELVHAAREAKLSVKNYTPSGGESQGAVDGRLAAFFSELFRVVGKMDLSHSLPRRERGFMENSLPPPHWHVLVVSHGGALHAVDQLLRQLQGCVLPQRHTATPNAAISSLLLTLENDCCVYAHTLTSHNTEHLDRPLSS